MASLLGDSRRRLRLELDFLGAFLQHCLTHPVPHQWEMVLNGTAKHVSTSANSPTFGLGCGVQTDILEKDW